MKEMTCEAPELAAGLRQHTDGPGLRRPDVNGLLAMTVGTAFVAHCLLNQPAKTNGGAHCAGIYSPLLDMLRGKGWRIEQMPCPELSFTGLNRFWAVREQLDTAAYRRHCQRQAAAVADMIAVRAARGEDIVLIGVEGSPSMGLHVTASDPARGGPPESVEPCAGLIPGEGLFFTALREALAARSIPWPRGGGEKEDIPPGHPLVARTVSAEDLLAGPGSA